MRDSTQEPVPGAAEGTPAAERSRRSALTRLGLAAFAVYATPTILRIDRAAAELSPDCEPPGDFPPGFPPPPCPL